jgi:hypothetical protein
MASPLVQQFCHYMAFLYLDRKIITALVSPFTSFSAMGVKKLRQVLGLFVVGLD